MVLIIWGKINEKQLIHPLESPSHFLLSQYQMYVSFYSPKWRSASTVDNIREPLWSWALCPEWPPANHTRQKFSTESIFLHSTPISINLESNSDSKSNLNSNCTESQVPNMYVSIINIDHSIIVGFSATSHFVHWQDTLLINTRQSKILHQFQCKWHLNLVHMEMEIEYC